MFFSNNLSDIDHCFFSKLGGNSKKIYSSLNCGMGSSDNKTHVKKNLSYISKYYELSSKNLITMYQTHSTKCKVIKNNTMQPIKADSLVTNQANLILCVLSADCAPILFYDPKKRVIGACHAGWKGALNGVIENTLKSMKDCGSKLQSIRCAIGPCIDFASYEVRKDFYQAFLQKSLRNKQFFERFDNDKYLFSLSDFITSSLLRSGINNVENINIDTVSNESLCFSYRRSFIKKENDYGRMISTIVIKE